MTLSVHIIGGGPAGCATALALYQQAQRLDLSISINIVTDSDTAAFHIGETIPPAATESLTKLGISELLNEGHLSCPGSISVWGNKTPGYNDFLFTPVGQGYHLNRKLFNQQLVQCCQNLGIQLINDTKIKKVETKANKVTLTLQKKSEHTTLEEITTDFVVDATGIRGFVARALGVTRNEYDSVLSLCAFYNTPDTNNRPSHTLVSTSNVGWWYASQLPKNQAIVSLCTDAETLKQHQLKQPADWFNHFLATDWFFNQCTESFQCSLDQPEDLHLRVSPSAILTNCVGQRWLAVGDAASSYDSMTSAGITKALNHGILAGNAIGHFLLSDNSQALKDYQATVFNDFNQYLRLHQLLYSKEQRYIDSGFWKRRIFS
ncbi:NAD(P)/FAD-dependent oxidoreductase [Sessilibacter corallicola]|uniref:Tryptophan 7-halogenase n=1 Tax=Sessilibacter corallicola TaxID=2904075 RepID=A0ABQ0A8B2_9GAMM